MLSESQVDFVATVSGAALGGLMLGALCGVLVGPVVRFLKSRNDQDIFAGVVLSVVPGAVVASMVALFFALVETAVFAPGQKGGYAVPDWFAVTMVALAIVAGAFTSWQAARRDPPMESHKRTLVCVIFWGAGGGLLCSFAFVGLGFNGYFVVQNNSGPVSYAILGFVFGSFIAVLWRLATAALGASLDASGKHAALA